MTLPTSLGPYAVERELGRGGMGVVYLGRDTRLDRAVAIKVVPEALALNPENLARFEREAKLLAAVNHPNIASIYGVEDAGGQRVLIMEYVAGETLGERLRLGPMPIAEALDVGRQIASAIEAAHEAGIVHRDLKPGNVKVTPDGIVKVLDFGLAKGGVATNADLAHSPTVTFSPTMAGVILGTAGYMSPEQARGKPVDRRADIWAFGVVLFECLTGRRAFDGETVSDTIARILEREPAWDSLPAATPSRVRALLRRCLEKDLRKRRRDFGEVRIELEEMLAERSASGTFHPAATSGRTGVAGHRWALAALLVALGVAGGYGARSFFGGPTSANGKPLSLAVSVPASLRTDDVTFGRDGESLIVKARSAARPGSAELVDSLFRRRLSGFEFTPIAGTERVEGFALSPDGKWLAVLKPVSNQSSDLQIEKISVDGSSPPIKITDVERGWADFIWLGDGDLLIRTVDPAQFIRVPSGGGPHKPRVKLDLGKSGELWFGLGRELPDGSGVLAALEHFTPRGFQLDIYFVDTKTGTGHVVVEDAAFANYREDLGHLLFARNGSIMAVPFDTATHTTRGDVVALMDGLRSTGGGPGDYALSAAGHLVFPPGGRVGADRRVVAVTPAGGVTAFNADARGYEDFLVVSADGRNVAVVIEDARQTYETYLVEAGGQRARRLAAANGADMVPQAFSPDGTLLAIERFAKDKDDGVYVHRIDGSGTPRRVLANPTLEVDLNVSQWSSAGLVIDRTTNSLTDIMLLPISKSGEPGALVPIRQTPADEDEGRISPDGTLIAFDSEESGRDELYVARFSGGTIVGQPVPLAVGDRLPRWSRDSRRIYFQVGSRSRVMVSTIETTPSLRIGTATVAWDLQTLRIMSDAWDILPDGRLVGVQRSADEADLTSYHLVLNWIDSVKSKLGVR